MSRTVADAALMMTVIAGPDDRDRATLPEPNFKWMDVLRGDLKGKRVAFSPDWGYARGRSRGARRGSARRCRCSSVTSAAPWRWRIPGFDNPLGDVRLADHAGDRPEGHAALVDKYESHMMPHLVGLVRARYTDDSLTAPSSRARRW